MIRLAALFFRASLAFCASLAFAANSPVNQVFQFMHSGEYSAWNDGATTKATSYLWIPEHCRRVRGVLVLGQNVPEHMLVGNPAIREVCARNDLAIVWSTPSFWYSKGKDEYAHIAQFLQQQLNGLARTSGYSELATAPWLPMGESGHLLMVDALVEAAPERCIAGIWMKNAHLPPKNRTVPALVVYGTAQEWTQDKNDFRKVWKNLQPYETVLKERAANPGWPLSFVVDGTSGHFDVSERLVQYLAHYIDMLATARLSDARLSDGGKLKPLDLKTGVTAGLPLPGYADSPASVWFPDRDSAEEARKLAAIDWNAQSQLPAFADDTGQVAPYDFNGIQSLTPKMEPDGLTFRLEGTMLPRVPANFAGAGEPLPVTPGDPSIEWLCGPVMPLGNGVFRIALDRTWPQHPVYLAIRKQGAPGIRPVVQPIAIKLTKNTEGRKQTISFDALPDIPAGTQSVALHAVSDSGLPVGFYVVAGPAIIENGKLLLTPIPPRASYPVSVTVAAWQWGRAAEPRIRTADLVQQTFRIVSAPSTSDLYVAPGGNDSAPGTKDKPLRTLEAARDRMRAAGSPGTVWLAPGVYPRTASLLLTAADSKTVWRAQEPQTARLNAAVPVPKQALQPVTDPALLARMDPSARGHVVMIDAAALGLKHMARFPDLFENSGGIIELYGSNGRLPLSRWPNSAYTHMVRVTDPGTKHGGTFVYDGDRPARWTAAVAGGLWLNGFWRVPWTTQKVRVESIDPAAHTITQAVAVPNGIGSKYAPPAGDGKEPWYALNLLEEIDMPGEWSLDFSTRRIYLWPPDDGVVSIADLADPVISMNGASDVRIEGLVFEGGLGSGVEIRGGEGGLIAGAVFRNLGQYGVKIQGGTQHGVQSSDFYNLGEGGVALNGGDRRTLTPARHYAVNNHFHDLSQVLKTYAPAVNVSGVGMLVAHNLIHDLPHAAILYSGNDHVFEYNEIHNIALDSGDVGAFYTGNDWTSRGNVLRYNYVHHASGANAFYIDDGDSGVSVLNNLIYRTAYGVFIGGGHDNTARGNFMVETAHAAIHLDARGIARHYDTTDKHKMDLLAGVDYRHAPWSDRYPELLHILEHPELPTGNTIEGNTLIGCAETLQIEKAVPRDLNTIRDNRALPAAPDFRALVTGIPLDRIGLEKDAWRVSLPTVKETGGDSDRRLQKSFDSDTDRKASDAASGHIPPD